MQTSRSTAYVLTTAAPGSAGKHVLAVDPRCALDVGGPLPTSLVVVRPLGVVGDTVSRHRVIAEDIEVVGQLPLAAAFGPNGDRVLTAMGNVLRHRAIDRPTAAPRPADLRESLAQTWLLAAEHDRLVPAAALVHRCATSADGRGSNPGGTAAALLLGALVADVAPAALLDEISRPWRFRLSQDVGIAKPTAYALSAGRHVRR